MKRKTKRQMVMPNEWKSKHPTAMPNELESKRQMLMAKGQRSKHHYVRQNSKKPDQKNKISNCR